MENEWGLPPVSEEQIDDIVKRLKLSIKPKVRYIKKIKKPQGNQGRFTIRKVDEALPDHSVCLNCGGKKKQPKWKKTHFCSLKCFANYKKKKLRKSGETFDSPKDRLKSKQFMLEEGYAI